MPTRCLRGGEAEGEAECVRQCRHAALKALKLKAKPGDGGNADTLHSKLCSRS
jgi:hypothetical protein